VSRGLADDELIDPFLLQADAIAGGRSPTPASAMSATTVPPRGGPNVFARKLSDQRFLETVIQGRKGTQMPAFGLRLSLDEVWQIHAFVKSTDHY
jgi:hypothetical protein